MINLRLAEYDLKTGKFKRFLELGTGQGYFGYYGNFIKIANPSNDDYQIEIELDEKDPLNRFEGAFHGRTYGEGKFILMMGFDLDGQQLYEDDYLPSVGKFLRLEGNASYSCCYGINAIGLLYDFGSDSTTMCIELTKGCNIHERPELFKKLK